jgi:hypothetical protein
LRIANLRGFIPKTKRGGNVGFQGILQSAIHPDLSALGLLSDKINYLYMLDLEKT